MAIVYNKVARRNLQKPNEPAKWYLCNKSIGTVTESEVARQIAEETTLNPKEAEMALAQLRKIVLRNLHAGNTVRLGDWAYFYATLQCEGAETEKEAVPAKVKKVAMHLGYDKTFQADLNNATFVSAKSLQKKEDETTTEEP